MSAIKDIKQIIEESQALKLVAESYSEIAATKLQKIRKGIEKNRTFFQEVSQVFHIVKVAAIKRNIGPAAKSKGTMSLILTSNNHFYGDLEIRLLRYFVVNTAKFKTDRFAIGKTAMDFLTSMQYAHPYQLNTFKNDIPEQNELRQIVANLEGYSSVLVYYSRMQSVLVQEPHVVDIVQAPPEHFIDPKKHNIDYIFEPEISEMLRFFENQIIQLLLEQTFLESELARTAARLISMDEAQGNADELITAQRKILGAAKKSVENMRLLETISSLTGWRRAQHAKKYIR